MSETAVQTLHTGGTLAPVEIEFPTAIGSSAEASLDFLQRTCQSLRILNTATVYFCVMLGRQLILIQQQGFWKQFPGMEDIKDWSDFMARGFSRLTASGGGRGWSREKGYGAIKLAKCRAIASLPPEDLRRFDNLSNAYALATLERRNGSVAPEIVQAAMTLGMDEFREHIGQGKAALCQAVVDNPEALGPLQQILNFLKLAEPDSLEHFWRVIERAKLRSGDNPNDTIDCIAGCCDEQWLQEAATAAEAAL